ncbi:MAG: phosphoenolpyruvate carboxykinase [Moorellaceae bacterium]
MIDDLRENNVIILGPSPCETAADMLKSKIFWDIVREFLRQLEERRAPELEALQGFRSSEGDYDLEAFTDLLLLLTDYRPDEIIRQQPSYAEVLANGSLLYDFIEGLYNFWRKHPRFLIIDDGQHHMGETASDHQKFIKLNERFKNLVLETYRKICANLMDKLPRVYRQLPCGAGVGILAERIPWDLPGEEYTVLGEIPFIRLAVIEPPLVYYPKRNYRKGAFAPVAENPLWRAQFKVKDWICYPAKVGDMLIFIYFHKRYLPLGASLANLFELASPKEIYGQRPEGILIFGVDQEILGKRQTGYYEDKKAGVVVGFVARSDEVDYFGYFKKMALTLHNLVAIERGYLPVHGAMARIILRTGESANVVLVGDSGAGKSETLEAFRVLADEYLRKLIIIFDDMGSLRLERQGRVVAVGTEIGAFVRLDDLAPGFAYEEIDRSIFMNPHKKNARLVIPITKYQDVIAGYPVDLFLYANNYEPVDENHPYIDLFTDVETALEVFSEGSRLSKGTTDEEGLTHTYFANPFGAPQKREQHDALARQYLGRMLATGVRVGQMRTQLGLPGYEIKGPEAAAKALFDFITQNKRGV